MKTSLKLVAGSVFALMAATSQATVIIDNSTGGLYNDSIGDLAPLYGPSQFPGPNVSEGDPTINPAAEPTVFTSAFGADWLNGDYTGGAWTSVPDIPNHWAVNTESAIVYDFNLAATSDLHIDLGVDNGVFVWLNGDYLFGALRGGGAHISEYDIDLSAVSAGSHKLQILREDHGGGTGFQINMQVVKTYAPTDVPEPSSLLMILGLFGLAVSRRIGKAK